MFRDRFEDRSIIGLKDKTWLLVQDQSILKEMLPIILILALAGPIAALDGGTSVWFYSRESSRCCWAVLTVRQKKIVKAQSGAWICLSTAAPAGQMSEMV